MFLFELYSPLCQLDEDALGKKDKKDHLTNSVSRLCTFPHVCEQKDASKPAFLFYLQATQFFKNSKVIQ